MPKYLQYILVIALFLISTGAVFIKGASIDNDVARTIHTRLKDKGITEWKAAASDYIHRNELDSAHVCYSYIAQISGKGSSPEEIKNYAAALNGLGVIYYLYGN